MTVQALDVTVSVRDGGQWPETWTLHGGSVLVEYPDGEEYGYSMQQAGLSELVQQLCTQRVVENPPFLKGVTQIYVESRKIDGEWKGA